MVWRNLTVRQRVGGTVLVAGAFLGLDLTVERLALSKQFPQPPDQAFSHTQQVMRQYSAVMDRVFSRYLRSAARSASPSGLDTGMRGRR
ncbi:MAG: hypothetical protein CL477_14510 [Acidobacteria bacterium]|jgi:hypothetical protein|nr:hypothetical protein [Acidobacteriota bacterium]MDP7338331.1 hypothetical protein [Vicinamibacterales bacterium]MDP7480166.1 hypothetical protein [Vicinamibacterales bacterium]MDP7691611.1 hypothetical protein [Vicinamibacterales bacterium]HJN44115.1 hypothetical protein [Vicinamibacterales bacterium]|tara:strand:+ start:713 stop:979 length:267 start_codon:yes stop_codon:yes gene_type:complete